MRDWRVPFRFCDDRRGEYAGFDLRIDATDCRAETLAELSAGCAPTTGALITRAGSLLQTGAHLACAGGDLLCDADRLGLREDIGAPCRPPNLPVCI